MEVEAIGGQVLIFVLAFCWALASGHAVEQRKCGFNDCCYRRSYGDGGLASSGRTMKMDERFIQAAAIAIAVNAFVLLAVVIAMI